MRLQLFSLAMGVTIGLHVYFNDYLLVEVRSSLSTVSDTHNLTYLEPLFPGDVFRGDFDRYLVWDRVRARVRVRVSHLDMVENTQ